MSARGEWVPMSREEQREFLNRKGVRRTAAHQMNRRAVNWNFCGRCGLIALKNASSRKALAAPCTWEE